MSRPATAAAGPPTLQPPYQRDERMSLSPRGGRPSTAVGSSCGTHKPVTLDAAEAHALAVARETALRPSTAPLGYLKRHDYVPLKALRPDFQRPTSTELELGPAMVTAHGSDLGIRAQTARSARPMTKEANREYLPSSARMSYRQQASNVAVTATTRKNVEGHSEAVLSVMREFFKTRPLDVLREVFRDQDKDFSGALDVEEFKTGLRNLHLGLTDRDVETVFRACDVDSGGTIELDEFLNVFRKDDFPRRTFFWDETRPRGLLDRSERIAANQELNRAKIHVKHSADQIIDLIQQKVDNHTVKQVFNSLDDNRSGRVASRELVDALREMDIHVSDTDAQVVCAKINEKVGDTRRTHIGFSAFTAMFNRGTNKGTVGDDSGPGTAIIRSSTLAKAEEDTSDERPSSRGGPASATYAVVWKGAEQAQTESPMRKKGGLLTAISPMSKAYADATKSATVSDVTDTAEAVHPLAPGREEEEDSVQRWAAMRAASATPEVVRTKRIVRGKKVEMFNQAIHDEMVEADMIGKRHDQMAGWRGNSGFMAGVIEGDTAQVVSTFNQGAGREINWRDYESSSLDKDVKSTILGEPAPLPLELDEDMRRTSPRSTLDLSGDVRTVPNTRVDIRTKAPPRYGYHRGHPKATPHIPIAAPGSTAECFYSAPRSALYLDDKTRLDRRTLAGTLWNPPNSIHLHVQKLRRERGERMRSREYAQLQAEQSLEATAESHHESLCRSKREYRARVEDVQRVIESRATESGVETVKLDPSSFGPGFRPAQPHLTSHWKTIYGSHLDPPPREHVKPVISFRRAFPEMDKKPVADHVGPSWGAVPQPTAKPVFAQAK